MKRLIKSEFYDSKKRQNITSSCYKNPTSKEWEEVKITYYSYKDNNGDNTTNTVVNKIAGIRGICHPNGDVFICQGEILHHYMVSEFGIEEGLHFEGDSPNKIIIRIENDMDLEYLKNIFNKCQSLYNYYSKDTRIECEGDNGIYLHNKAIVTINELLKVNTNDVTIHLHNNNGELDIDAIRKNRDSIPEYAWDEFARSEILSEDFMREFIDKLGWVLINEYQNLSNEFRDELRKHYN